MPHLTIEYSANLVDLDPTQVLRAAVAALADVGAYDMGSTKARIRRCDEYAVGHPDTGDGFVAVTLAALPGRSEEVRRATAQALTEAVSQVLPPRPGTQVTSEVRELGEYAKRVL